MAYELQSTISTTNIPDFVLYSNGSIWVGTSDHVWRIDLVTLATTNIFNGRCNTNLVEDQYGYIWFMSTAADLYRIDPSNNSVTTVTVVASQTSDNRLSLVAGELWLHVSDPPFSRAIYRVDPSTYVATFVVSVSGLSGSSPVTSFFVGLGGYIWFPQSGATIARISQLDPATNTIVSNTTVDTTFTIFQAGIAAYGYVWATSNNGLLRFNTSSLTYSYDGGSSVKALVDHNGSLYTSSYADVYKYDVNTLTTTTIITTTGEQIGDFRFDNAGNLYLAVITTSGTSGRTLKYVIPAVGWVRGHAWG